MEKELSINIFIVSTVLFIIIIYIMIKNCVSSLRSKYLIQKYY